MRNALYPRGRQSVWDLMSDVEKIFDEAWSPRAETRREVAPIVPEVDIRETGDYYLVTMDVPGIRRQDIKIDFNQGRLTISGERTKETRSEKEQVHRLERQYGRFERSFQLPNDIDDSKIQARYEDGVLEVLVPKTEVSKPRTISIETERKGLFSKLLGGKETAETKSEH